MIAKSGRAVEAAGDVHVLLLDKTGTITFGNRRCSALYAAPGVSGKELAEGALLASLADDTPEGKSIVEYLRILHPIEEPRREELTPIAFSAETRLSGVDWNGQVYRKGAVDAALRFIDLPREKMPEVLSREVDKIAQSGGTPLLVVANGRLLGAIHLKDVVKPGIRERFAELRRLGIRTVMVTGDNPLTAAAIAAEAGVDDVIAEATPEKKLARIRQEQGPSTSTATSATAARPTRRAPPSARKPRRASSSTCARAIPRARWASAWIPWRCSGSSSTPAPRTATAACCLPAATIRVARSTSTPRPALPARCASRRHSSGTGRCCRTCRC